MVLIQSLGPLTVKTIMTMTLKKSPAKEMDAQIGSPKVSAYFWTIEQFSVTMKKSQGFSSMDVWDANSITTMNMV